MELSRIRELLANKELAIFGPGELKIKDWNAFEGNHYIMVDMKNKYVRLTTDTTDFRYAGRIEEMMEMIYGEFKITDFRVLFHVHPGKSHDKDILINFNNVGDEFDEVPEIVKFIQDNFYKSLNWESASK